jgi:hypothetical protein
VKDRTDQDCGDRHDLPTRMTFNVVPRLARSCAAEKDRGHRGDRRRSPLVTRKQKTPLTEVSANPENDAVTRSEPPDTDPYVRWCGGRRLITSGYPSWALHFIALDMEMMTKTR